MARLNADRPTFDRWIGLGLVAALVVLALVRIALGGWGPLAPDDARYLYVGLSIFDGRGPVNPSGNIFLLRSPVYGLALATGSSLAGGDPLVGARIVAVGLTLLGLAGALRLGWLLAGLGGAVGTAFALVATPLVWRLVPSLRIDLPQTAAIIAVLLAVWRPTTRRWALGGVLLGLAILVKETAAPLLLLPIALVGSVPPRRLARLAAAFVVATVVTAAWWWLVVWFARGEVFPLNALSILEARDVEAPLRVARTAVPLLIAIVVAWGLVAWQARRSPGPRLLLAAGLGLAPAALYAAQLGLNARNFAGLAVLSAVAIGAAGAWLVAGLRARRSSPAAGRSRVVAGVALAVVAAVALAGPVIGQRDAGRMPPAGVADDLAAWLATNVPEDARIVMAFREREAMALRRFGRMDVTILPTTRVGAADAPETYVWMGLRDRQLFGYTRAEWVAALTDPPATYLVLVSPHPFTPVDLVDARGGGPSLPGLVPVATLDRGGDHVDILRIDPSGVRDGTADVPLHLTADAALAWLDEAGTPGAEERLLQARPVVSGDGLAALLARLGGRTCEAPAPAGATQLGPAGSCPG